MFEINVFFPYFILMLMGPDEDAVSFMISFENAVNKTDLMFSSFFVKFKCLSGKSKVYSD